MFPVMATLILASCSEEAAEETNETTQEQQKPLIEREPEVKDYLETMNEMIDEYIGITETLLNTVEDLDAGELNYLESALAAQTVMESWEKLEELEESLEQQEGLQEQIEKRLNGEDIKEFAMMCTETLARLQEVEKRIENSSLQKYLK